MPNEINLNAGVDLQTGKTVPDVVFNSLASTVSGSATAAGAIATFTLNPLARAVILRVYITNEGTGGASSYALEAAGATVVPYYLPSAGEIMDSGTLKEPIAVIANTSTTSSITVGIYAVSVASGNTVRAAVTYTILPDWRPPV